MPDEHGSSLVDRFLQVVVHQFMRDVKKNVERHVKRAIRMVAMVIAGVTIAVIGLAFLAVGAVKWFSILMPAWLAWAIVGIVLLLVGAILGLVGSRG